MIFIEEGAAQPVGVGRLETRVVSVGGDGFSCRRTAGALLALPLLLGCDWV